METKSDEERIVVNGGCFPLHWVRKFFNIATDDMEDDAVTEAKLSEAVRVKIGQSIIGMTMTFDSVSGTVTLTDNDGNAVRLAIASATTGTAGLMSAADKGKVENSVNGMKASATGSTVTLTQTKNGGTVSAVDIAGASATKAGVMTAVDKGNLDRSVCDVDVNASGNVYELTFYANDGTTVGVIPLDTATESTAGLMSKEDKARIGTAAGKFELETDYDDRNILRIYSVCATKEDGVWSEDPIATVTFPAATEDSAGMMSPEDKGKLDGMATGATADSSIPDSEIEKIIKS